MSNIPAAADLIETLNRSDEYPSHYTSSDQIEEAMITFAQLHYKAALEKIRKEAQAYYYDEEGHQIDAIVNESTILEAYPIENIK